jgi:transposase
VHYLPPYSPDLNPDEGVNADLKLAVPRKAPARSKPQLKRAAISHMRSLSRRLRWVDVVRLEVVTARDVVIGDAV